MSTKKLSKNVIIYGLSNVLKSLVPFIMLPLLTHYLSTEGLGTLSLIETALLLVSPLVIINLDTAIGIEFFKSSKEKLAKYIGNGIFLSLLSCGILTISTNFFSNEINSLFGIHQHILILIPLFALFRVIPLITLVLFQSQQKPITYLSFSVGQTIIDFAVSALLVISYKLGYLGRLYGIYGAFLIASIAGLFYLLKHDFITLKITTQKLRQVASFGLPLIPHAIGGTIIAMSDRYFISFFESNAQVGLYTVAYQIGAIMLLISMSVNQAWTPMAFELMKNKQFSQVRKLSAALLGLFLISAILIYLFRNIIFTLFIDNSFYQALQYTPLLLLGFMFQSCYFVVVKYLFFLKRTQLLASITFIGALSNLALNYFLIREFSVMGVAYATAISWGLILIVTFMVSKKYFFQFDSIN